MDLFAHSWYDQKFCVDIGGHPWRYADDLFLGARVAWKLSKDACRPLRRARRAGPQLTHRDRQMRLDEMAPDVLGSATLFLRSLAP